MSLLTSYAQDCDVMLEAYLGKPKEFIEIENRLQKIINNIKLTFENPSKAKDTNSMKELYEIEEIFTKFFGNDETSITFYTPFNLGINPQRNAFTIPSNLTYFRKDPNNKRLTRVEDLFINVNIDIGLVYYLQMTSQELMGIILHEIGHCFDASLFALLGNITLLFNVDTGRRVNETMIPIFGDNLAIDIIPTIKKNIINFLIDKTILASFVQQINRFLSSYPKINGVVTEISYLISSILNNIKFFKNSLILIQNPINFVFRLLNPRNLFGYGKEKFADSFATSYGYGKEIATFMYKMGQRKGDFVADVAQKIPVLNIGYDFCKATMGFATLMMNPHPLHATRIVSQLNKLKRDIQDPLLKPKIRKELEENIKEMEDYIDNVVLNKDLTENKQQIFTTLYNYIIIKIFKGKVDPRELFEAVWNHEM